MKSFHALPLHLFLSSLFFYCYGQREFVDVPAFSGPQAELAQSWMIENEHSIVKRAERKEPMTFPQMPRSKVKTPKRWIGSIVKEHNRLRALHNVPPLKRSEELCKTAQFWAEYLGQASEGLTLPVLFRKRWSGVAGNMWAAVGRKDANYRSPTFAWYNEERFYTYGNNSYCGMEKKGNYHVDHFTQLVWKGTTSVGCAKHKNKSGHIYVVCHYMPPGNYRGRYIENVPKPVKLE